MDDAPVELLYESGTTRVYRAFRNDRGVVVKQALGVDATGRADHEEGLLRSLCGVEGVAQLAVGVGTPGVLMFEDCGGTSLSHVLAAGRPQVGVVIDLAIALARILAAVHRAGILHCDVNPANILIAPDGTPVLIDFDLAVSVPGRSRSPGGAGGLAGTPGYFAPEQTGRTGHAVDSRSDLYSLGVTLFEIITGRLPFAGNDMLQLVHDHLVREPLIEPEAASRMPQALAAIILRLLAKSPDDRYQSADGLIHDLQRVREAALNGVDAQLRLGERDFPLRLSAPGLVARDTEAALLRAAFADAVAKGPIAVVVHGAAGVGKSALIQELRPAVLAANGRIVRGKVDLYQKEQADAGVLAQALCALGRLLLAQPADVLAGQRSRLVAAAGQGAGLLAAMSEEFALILGPQPVMAPADPRQAGLRQQQAIVDVIAAVASPAAPLVLVLDDLQWAGTPSLRGFERLMNEPGLAGLLLVAVYRDDDPATGNIDQLLAATHPQTEPLRRIMLANLGPLDSASMLAKLLRIAPQRAHELATAIHRMSGGNPFDMLELVNALRDEGIISLQEHGWHWEAEAIRNFVSRGDVSDLLATRVAGLAGDCRSLLASMSCLGTSVDLALLAAATGHDEAELVQRLRPAVQDGLLVRGPSGGNEVIGFRHDRVQQAVLSAGTEGARAACQLDMARRLIPLHQFGMQAAQQYLACLGQLDGFADAAEIRRVVHLFHGAAQRTAGMARFELAERYLSAASRLLAVVSTAPDEELGRDIDARWHEALCCLGRHDLGDTVFQTLWDRVSAPVDLVDTVCLQLQSIEARGDMRRSSTLGLEMLARLGVVAPPGYAVAGLEQQLTALVTWLERDAGVDHTSRPLPQSRQVLATAKVLVRLTRSAYSLADMGMATWLLLESQHLWARHGPCPDLIANFGGYYGVYVMRRQDFRVGYDMCRHAIAVGEALGWEPQTSLARHAFGGFSCHWFEPLENALQQLQRAFEGTQAAGELVSASQVQPIMTLCLLDIAPTLDLCQAAAEKGLATCRATGNVLAMTMHTASLRLILALRGLTKAPASFDDAAFSEADFLTRFGHLPYVGKLAYQHALNALILGDGATVVAFADRPFERTAIGNYTVFHMHLIKAMARAWQLQDNSVPDRAAAGHMMQHELEWLAARAADQPYNFLHLFRLAQAEAAWGLGRLDEAAQKFDDALGEAESRPRPWHGALIAERAGLFHLARGMGHAGRSLVSEAFNRYKSWGAAAKAAVMQKEHGFLTGTSRSAAGVARSGRESGGKGSVSISADTVDLVGVLRASQALSSETSVQRLTARVSEVLAALSGATGVLVLSRHDGQWMLLTPDAALSPIPLAAASAGGMLPLSVFRYVERTGASLLVDDACVDDRFASDPYFAGVPQCSLLVTPIAGQGGLDAMLLLENRHGRAAFNAQRLDAVKLIAGQLVVSLENAQLYESLEERVQERTRELTDAQARLVTTARRAGMAEIANNVLHNVGNVLNSVNVSASLARRTLGASRLEGLARAVGLINEHAADLGGFIHGDPRGAALVPYLNAVVEALRKERDTADGDLERLIKSVDHISYVVATQQSHAGPSSVLEPARPEDLLEEALRMSAEAIERYGVHVERRYDPIAVGAIDRPRLLQILVNMIANAAHAMKNNPAGLRRVVVSTALLQADAGPRLQVSVRDEGVGIAPEDMGRIFAHGFTTRSDGHGFGLHSSALAAMEMGGTLGAHSDGPGKGALFTLDLPFNAVPPP
ncbi:MAG: ATPase [Comamonadaceae bacterium]|nr:MAG: ATPase [Comamonadaceae bacterium]